LKSPTFLYNELGCKAVADNAGLSLFV